MLSDVQNQATGVTGLYLYSCLCSCSAWDLYQWHRSMLQKRVAAVVAYHQFLEPAKKNQEPFGTAFGMIAAVQNAMQL